MMHKEQEHLIFYVIDSSSLPVGDKREAREVAKKIIARSRAWNVIVDILAGKKTSDWVRIARTNCTDPDHDKATPAGDPECETCSEKAVMTGINLVLDELRRAGGFK